MSTNQQYQPFDDNENMESLVYPCCCGTRSEEYFRVYTILLIVFQSMSLLGNIIGSFDHPEETDWLGIVFGIGFLIWLIVIFKNYKQTGNYGTKSAYILSIIKIVVDTIILLFLIIGPILIVGFKVVIFPEIKELKPEIIIGVAVVLIVLVCYMLYLDILYMTVIKKRKEANVL